jgi:hypothetical protein
VLCRSAAILRLYDVAKPSFFPRLFTVGVGLRLELSYEQSMLVFVPDKIIDVLLRLAVVL